MNKRIMVFGSNGQIGNGFRKAFAKNPNYNTVYFIDSNSLNYFSAQDVAIAFNNIKPDVVINCVAFTDVDGAEKEENRQECVYLNTQFPYMLAALCRKAGAEFIHFSTDYVYNGAPTSNAFTEKDVCEPLNYYGQTKLRGDKLVLCFDKIKIFRVQCVYSPHNKNFYKTISRLALEKESLDVVNDQITCPTHAYWIADTVCQTLDIHQYGIFNLKPDGNCSFADFAELIVDGKCVINRIASSQYPSKTKRPKNSTLSNDKFLEFFSYYGLLDWKQVYKKYSE